MPKYIGHNIDNTAGVVERATVSTSVTGTATLYLPLVSDVNDDSSTPRTMAAVGAVISSTQKKFGAGSLFLDGVNDYVTISGTDWDFGTTNFTIDGWFYCTDNTTAGWAHIIGGCQGGSGWNIAINPSTKAIQFYENGLATGAASSWTLNTWHHIAVVRNGTNISTYIDGTSIDSDTIGAGEQFNTDATSGGAIEFGRRHNSSSETEFFTGYLQDWRIFKGVVCYTGNFIVPRVPRGNDNVNGNVTKTYTYAIDNKWNSGVWSMSESSGEGYSINSRRKSDKWATTSWFQGAAGYMSVTKFSPLGSPEATPTDLGSGGLRWLSSGGSLDFTEAGYYQVVVGNAMTLDMWAWGGAGGAAPNQGFQPGQGPASTAQAGAGGGVRGRKAFSAGDTITVLVAQGGSWTGGVVSEMTAFPDGGQSSSNGSGGGGSSRIAAGLIPFANRNAAPSPYLLIGGGGGGTAVHASSGTRGMAAGYPTGLLGGGYYPSDGNSTGRGGTQSAGGAGGPLAGRQGAGFAGGKYAGGTASPNRGGAGGGGYYGGGSGTGFYNDGGGGSSFISPAVSSSANFHTTAWPGTYWKAVDDSSNPGTKPVTAGEPYFIPSSGTEITPATGTVLQRAGFVKLKVV